MSIQQTLSIIKPDAVSRNITGKINAEIENAGLKIVAQKMIHMTKKQGESFYAVHKERLFFDELTSSISLGPVVVQVLSGENAVTKYRDIMGATNPKDAAPDTIRAKYALSISNNSVHGSDSAENAAIEIAYFFAKTEIVS